MKPLLRGHFHQAMFFVAIGACGPLLLKSTTKIERVATITYSIGTITMFGVSALYHRISWDQQKRAFLKKLDHSAIYLMMAGNFTPVALLALSETSGSKLLLTIWSIAFIGIIQSILFVNLPKIVSALIYLFAGFTVLPYLPEIQNSIGTPNLILIIAGGIIYALGALSYGLKWPNLKPDIFGYHELFHVFVSIAAIMHFFVIESLIK